MVVRAPSQWTTADTICVLQEAQRNHFRFASAALAAGFPPRATLAGRTLLHLAAASSWDGDPDRATMVALALHRGADPNARDRWGRTPLWIAAATGSPDMMRALVAAGADVNATDRRIRVGFPGAAFPPLLALCEGRLWSPGRHERLQILLGHPAVDLKTPVLGRTLVEVLYRWGMDAAAAMVHVEVGARFFFYVAEKLSTAPSRPLGIAWLPLPGWDAHAPPALFT